MYCDKPFCLFVWFGFLLSLLVFLLLFGCFLFVLFCLGNAFSFN